MAQIGNFIDAKVRIGTKFSKLSNYSHKHIRLKKLYNFVPF